MSVRQIIHLDMDSFYVSVERLKDPSLIGVPVAVGGSADGRGVVASASYEARDFGVHSAMPMSQALRLCPHLKVVSSSFTSYSKYTNQVHETLLEFTPLVQMASQDEAYIDLSGTERLWGPTLVAAEKIRELVLERTKLPCSLGVASNKLVAKVASALCKPRGLLYIPYGSEEAFFAPLPIKKLPGIGKQTQKRLIELGINTLGDIANLSDERAKRLFGEQGASFRDRARGISNLPVITESKMKSMSAETTFSKDSADGEFLAATLSNLCEKVAYRLRKENLRAATITVKYRYSDFETHTVSETVASPIDDENDLYQTARRLLESKRVKNKPIRLIGVGGTNLSEEGEEQIDFLEVNSNEHKKRLHQAIDQIRSKHGYQGIQRASSGGKAEEKNEDHWG